MILNLQKSNGFLQIFFYHRRLDKFLLASFYINLKIIYYVSKHY
jgi:hypothetical protein